MRPPVPAPALARTDQPGHPVVQVGKAVLRVQYVQVIELAANYGPMKGVIGIEGQEPVRMGLSRLEGDVARRPEPPPRVLDDVARSIRKYLPGHLHRIVCAACIDDSPVVDLVRQRRSQPGQCARFIADDHGQADGGAARALAQVCSLPGSLLVARHERYRQQADFRRLEASPAAGVGRGVSTGL